jgi:hypothetical protein
MKLRKHPLEPFDLFLINLAAQLDTSTIPQWLIWSDILACKMVPHCLPRSKRFAAFRACQIQLIVLCNTLGVSIIAHLCHQLRSVQKPPRKTSIASSGHEQANAAILGRVPHSPLSPACIVLRSRNWPRHRRCPAHASATAAETAARLDARVDQHGLVSSVPAARNYRCRRYR